ncbi:restriction endonuclease subunit S [Guyparkeria halopsychrophila]|uniref:restriction endonuclease subunit S n=1 Tax=Guyparkeria halopsychrophila TaxID=3139421 RepID=UPI0037CADB5B
MISLEYGKPLPKDQRCEEGGFPAYGANGIKCYAVKPFWEKRSIIVGRKGTAGAVNLVEGGFWPLDVTYYVTFNERENDLKFIYYMLSALDLPSLATGVKPGINRNVVYAIERPFPPLPEQKRIVAILDEAFAGIDTAIANTEKNLANARELFESYLNAVFTREGDGWKDVTIGDIAHVKGGKRVPKGYKLQTEPTKHPYISVSDFNDTGSVVLEKIKFISEDVYQQISRYTISSTDLYISIAGTIGKSGIIPKELEGANLTENACKLVLDKDISNRYLYFFTRTESFKEQALKNTRTAAQPKLALERLKTIRLSIPPFEIQEGLIGQFNDLWSQSQELESIYKQKLTALTELKQSLLQKAFSGELTADAADAADTVEAALA